MDVPQGKKKITITINGGFSDVWFDMQILDLYIFGLINSK